MKSFFNNFLLIIIGTVGIHIMSLLGTTMISGPDLSVQSYFWNGTQAGIQLLSLCLGSCMISALSKKYAKMNSLILGGIFLILHSFTLWIFWSPLIPEFQHTMIALVVLTLPSAYLGYVLSRKLRCTQKKISKETL